MPPMLYMAGGDHLPVKFLPSRQLMGPRPPVPPIPTANFFTLGITMMQSAFATVLAETSLEATIDRSTVVAFLMVSSSLFTSAPQAGRVNKARSRVVRKQDSAVLLCCIGIQTPFFLQKITRCPRTQGFYQPGQLIAGRFAR